MQLNESTYETIFLSYIDKELSPKENLEVEDFMAAHPAYAMYMEALKATVLEQETTTCDFKAQLKQIAATPTDDTIALATLAALDAEWDASYKKELVEDLQSIEGLSIGFKESLKQHSASKSLHLHPFGFNQNKFTYAAIAASLMVFLGYQQLTNTPNTNTLVSQSKINTVSKSNTAIGAIIEANAYPNVSAKDIETTTSVKTTFKLKSQVNSKEQISIAIGTQKNDMHQKELIAVLATVTNDASIASDPSIANNTAAVNIAAQASIITTTNLADADTELTTDEKAITSYEIIDIEDPNRTIFIANFEIDGNKLRGLKRKVSNLFKNNKSDRN